MARTRTRPTRATTRASVVAAAREVFPELGYHRATVEEIATRAGLTIGAVYSNFARKADVFLAAYAEQMDRWIDGLERAVTAAGPEPAAAVRAASRRWARYHRDDRGWFLLYLEVRTLAEREPEILEGFLEESHRLREAIGELISRGARDAGVELRVSPAQAGVLLNAMSNGLLLEAAPGGRAVPAALVERSLTLLLSALIVP